MKKSVALLILCVVFAFFAVNFSACDFSVSNNSGKETTNEQPNDNEENGENNDENNEKENIVITADTDFAALKSDKVEKDVFINACKFFFSIAEQPYRTAKINCTMRGKGENDFVFTVQFDGLKRYVKAKDEDFYILISEDLQSYQTAYIENGQVKFDKMSLFECYNENQLVAMSEECWEKAVYNETSNQYEVSQIEYLKLSNVQIKIKNGYIVYIEYSIHSDNRIWIKCYDFGTTTVEIPDDIMQAMQNA